VAAWRIAAASARAVAALTRASSAP